MLSMGRSLHKRLVALPWSERPIRRLPPRMDLMPCRVGSQCPWRMGPKRPKGTLVSGACGASVFAVILEAA
jgi:hypothetical protein